MLTVGHNDPGFEPDVPPVVVSSVGAALLQLRQDITTWFSVEVMPPGTEGDGLTIPELKQLQRKAEQAAVGSRLHLRGHIFWIRTE